MSLICSEHGNAYGNMNSEAKELRRQYLQFCDECSKAHDFTCSGADAKACKEKKNEILKMMLDISDIRLFCVVTNKNEHIPCVRHIFRVEEQALSRFEELKEEYYETYAKLPDDNFCFFRGLHRAQAYAEEFMSREVGEGKCDNVATSSEIAEIVDCVENIADSSEEEE